MTRSNSRFDHPTGKRRDRFHSPSRGGTSEQRPRGAHTASSRRGDTRKRLSQNFLTDPRVAAAIVRESGVGRHDLVIEIGPGRGIITRALSRRCRRVVAYELDAGHARLVNTIFRDDPRVTCHHRDFLTTTAPDEDFSIVANIPFSRTNAIVNWCLEAPALTSATLVTQWEYARKRTGDYGRWSRLTVLSWPHYRWSLVGRINRAKFTPVPRTDSGILRIERRSRPLLSPALHRRYTELVMAGFTGVGGDVHRSLRSALPLGRLRKALAHADINQGVPVGYISPQQWLRLTEAVGP